MGRKKTRIGIFTIVAILGLACAAVAADTIKIAHIDPMSGPFADVGERANKQFQGVINELNAKGGGVGPEV